MSAFFFGPPERQLFGYHHVPRGPGTAAAVLCPPWGEEHLRAHGALRLLGKRLAARGSHVLRFDYSGTGDSWGESAVADLNRWVDDVHQAVLEVRAMSGIQQVDLVGLRLGACVAAEAARTIAGVRRVVLWDPITEGEAWLRELGFAGKAANGEPIELGGRMTSARFVSQIKAITPQAFKPSCGERVVLFRTHGEATPLRDHGIAALPDVESEWRQQPAPWGQDEFWTGDVPVKAAEWIADWLC